MDNLEKLYEAHKVTKSTLHQLKLNMLFRLVAVL